MSASWFNDSVAKLPAYVSGKRSEREDVIKLSSNEVPLETLPGVAAAVEAAIPAVNRYPDMANTQLIDALAEYHDWPAAGIVAANGSTALIEKIVQAVVVPGGEVMYPWRSFEAYPIAVMAAGGTPVPVPLNADGSHDLPAMLSAITPNTRCVIICSPNNPTGNVLSHRQVEDFISRVPSHIPVILDEAYIHFAGTTSNSGDSAQKETAVQNGPAIARKHPNVIVCRTFSKAYGLAGLRVGYGLTSEEMAGGLRAISTPFGVNTFAQAAAVAALKCDDEVRESAEKIAVQRDELRAKLAEIGWNTPQSGANFLWFEPTEKYSAEDIENACMNEGILVRRLGTEGVRVTVAEPEGGQRLIRALTKLAG